MRVYVWNIPDEVMLLSQNPQKKYFRIFLSERIPTRKMFMTHSFLIVGILVLTLISTAAQLRDASSQGRDISFPARKLQSSDFFASDVVGNSAPDSVEGALYATPNEEGSGQTEFSESASAFSNVSIEDSDKAYSSEAIGGSASGSTTYGGALYTNSNENKTSTEFSASASGSDFASMASNQTEVVLSTEATGGSASGSTTYGGALYMNSNEDAPGTLSTSAPADFSASSGIIPPTRLPTTPPLSPLSSRPTNKLTIRPSNRPTAPPTTRPTIRPTTRPSVTPTLRPTPIPAKNLSGEALDWVVAHNVRRKFLHESKLKAYVPLQWSEYLAGSAQAYAEKLLRSSSQCAIMHGFTGDSYGGGA